MAKLLTIPPEIRLHIWDLAIPTYDEDVDVCNCQRIDEKREYEPADDDHDDGDDNNIHWDCFGKAHLRHFVLDLPAPIIACRQTYYESYPIAQQRKQQQKRQNQHQHQHQPQRFKLGSMRCFGTLFKHFPAKYPDTIVFCLAVAPASAMGGGRPDPTIQLSQIRSAVHTLAVRYGHAMTIKEIRRALPSADKRVNQSEDGSGAPAPAPPSINLQTYHGWEVEINMLGNTALQVRDMLSHHPSGRFKDE